MAIVLWIKEHEIYAFGLMACCLLWTHFKAKYESSIVGIVGLSMALFAVLGYEVIFVMQKTSTTLAELGVLSFA